MVMEKTAEKEGELEERNYWNIKDKKKERYCAKTNTVTVLLDFRVWQANRHLRLFIILILSIAKI